MIGVLGQDSALQGCIWPETTWANEMNFVMNHALVEDIGEKICSAADVIISAPIST